MTKLNKKAVEEVLVEKTAPGNFWRMKVAPKEKIIIGDDAVHCVVVCKNCGPGFIRIVYELLGDEISVGLPCGHVRVFWIYKNMEVEGDPIRPSVIEMQFTPILK
jgi:hypothetical protein